MSASSVNSVKPLGVEVSTTNSALNDWWQSFQGLLSGGYIPALDAIRAVAVFLVIFYHFGYERINGPFGVEMFFALSGFLITWLLIRENDKSGDISFSGFYKRRTLRIFPAFYAYLIFGLAIYLVRHHEVPWRSVICSIFYVENYHEALFHTGDTFVSHTWSLAIEEQFYLLWPLFFWLFRKEYGRMIKFLSIVIGCVWIYRLILLFAVNAYQGYIYHAFEARMDHLLVGCLFAVLIRLGSIKKALYYICSRWYYPLVTIIIMCFSAGMHTNMIYKYSIGYALEPILIVALIAQMISLSGHSLWGKIVENPVMKYLGRISYPLYLYQQLTLFTTRRVAANLSKPIQFILACIVTIAIASASYFFIEKTFLKFKRPASREADHGMGRASGLAMQRTE